jgi:S-adenosylmethionine hydrolase
MPVGFGKPAAAVHPYRWNSANDFVPKELQGRITQISGSGDLVSDIPNSAVADLAGVADVRVDIGDHFTLGIFAAEHQEPESTLIAVLGKSGFVEVGIVGMNAAEMLGIRAGESIRISGAPST